MGRYASAIVSQARNWLGKKESDGSHKMIIDVYNSQKVLPRNYRVRYNDEWCATFISALAIKLGYTDIIPPECSCERMIEAFKKIGCWIENENRMPNVGYIVFYDWNDNGKGDCKGWADHVGIVVNVSRETFIIIEGNLDNMVKTKTLTKNARYLRGFAVPKYDKEVSKPSETVQNVPKCITEVAKMVIDGKFGNGVARKDNIYKAVQSEVNRLLKG